MLLKISWLSFKIILLFCLTLIPNRLICQDASTFLKINELEDKNFYFINDTIKKKQKAEISPRNCTLRSVFLPGFGQYTNKQSWKLPILYGGFALSIYSLDFANKNYQDFKEAYVLRTDGDSATLDKYDINNVNSDSDKYTTEVIKSARDYYRRNIELSILITTGIYLLNIIDAYVSAHLKTFDVSDDLSLEIIPPKLNELGSQRFVSTGIIIRF